MAKLPSSAIKPGHQDFELLLLISQEVKAQLGIQPEEAFSQLILEATEFVLDPIRTGRTTLSELDNVEKTFIG